MQTKLSSLTEQLLNVGSGWVLSLLIWTYFIVPVWDVQVSMLDNILITSTFTVISVARGYLWRRLFNNSTHLLTIGRKE